MKNKMAETRNLRGGGSFSSSVKFALIKKNKKKAFMLAEVLITLSIIGVIASFVIPMVKLKYQEMTTVAKLRQYYNLLNNYFEVASRKYGTPDRWGLISTSENGKIASRKVFNDILFADIKGEAISDLDIKQEINSLNNEDKQIIISDNFTDPIDFIFPGGVTISGAHIGETCNGVHNPDNLLLKNICGDFKVDINGREKPNIFGIDSFVFYFTKRGIVPGGLKATNVRKVDTHCNPNDKAVKYNGYGCTAWVIEKGTMPWLYGKQPKWDEE